jgi:hypothetical protein
MRHAGARFMSFIEHPKARHLGLPGLMAVMALTFPFTGVAGATTPRTVAVLDATAKETPENLVVAPNGDIYISLAFASGTYRRTSSGRSTCSR